MIYVIDHKDSFTHNVVHQLSLFDDVECDDFSMINKSKLTQASTIVFSPGPGENTIVDAWFNFDLLTLLKSSHSTSSNNDN